MALDTSPNPRRRGYTEYCNTGDAPVGTPSKELRALAMANYNECRQSRPHWPDKPHVINDRQAERVRWGWYLSVKEP
jgi:hypothetical protein